MIKVNELRIGSILGFVLPDNLCQLDGIYGEGDDLLIESHILNQPESHNSARGLHDFCPISITEEWLLKFGFIIQGKRISKDWFYLWSDKQKIFFALAEMHEVTGTYLVVESVHQLQNLYFALTGKELNITH